MVRQRQRGVADPGREGLDEVGRNRAVHHRHEDHLDEDEQDESQLEEILKDPKKAKALIKNLRKENAKHRTKGKNLEERVGKMDKAIKALAGGEEDDDEPAETRLERLTQSHQVTAYERAVLEKAVDHGISGKEGRELFEFYVQKAAAALEEGEEMTDDDFEEVAAKVKKMTGSKSARTSVDGKGRDKNPDDDGEVTLDKFAEMTVSEKTNLFSKNPDLYNRLMKEAVKKRRF